MGHDRSASCRRDTRVLVRRRSRELGSVPACFVGQISTTTDYHAVEQDNFPPDYRDLIAKLGERITGATPVSTSLASVLGPSLGMVPPTLHSLRAARIRHRRRAGQAGLRLPHRAGR